MRASDKRAVFVGLDAYEAAGGQSCATFSSRMMADGYRMYRCSIVSSTEKLQIMANEIANEGWKWIEVAVSFPYGAANGLRELEGTPVDLTDEEQATLGALRDEFGKLQAEYEEADELPDEVDQRFGQLETAIQTLEARPVRFDPIDIARAGVFVSVDADGSLLVERGYVKPEDEAPVAPDGESDPGLGELTHPATTGSVQRAVITIGGQPAEPEDDDEDGIKPLPDRLIMELTAERTLALRDKLANDPTTAFLAVLHKFVRDVFSRYSSHGVAMEISVRGTVFAAQSPELRDTPCARDRRPPQGLGNPPSGRHRGPLGYACDTHRRRTGRVVRPLRIVRRECAL